MAELSDDDLIAKYAAPSGELSDDDLMAKYAAKPKAAPGSAAARLSAGDRFAMGAVDPVYGAAQTEARIPGVAKFADALDSGLDMIFGTSHRPISAPDIDKYVNEREKQYQDARGPNAGIDWARLGGDVATTLPLARINPLAAGAAGGALNPVTDVKNDTDFWEQKGEQTGTGAIAGKAMQVGGNALARVIKPVVGQAAQALVDAGVKLTPGQWLGPLAKGLEERATSIPGTGYMVGKSMRNSVDSFNKAFANKVLEPIGETVKAGVDAGHDLVSHVESKLSGAYDAIKPKLTFAPDPTLLSDIKSLVPDIQTLPTDIKDQLKGIIKHRILEPVKSGGGKLDGEGFKKVESELSRAASAFKGSSDGFMRDAGHIVDRVNGFMRDALERANPAEAARLRDINKSWALFTRMRSAAANRSKSEGVFTPADLLTAVKRGDKSVAKGAFARGDALAQDFAETGNKVIGNAYPDSGTAGRNALLAFGGTAMVNPALAAKAALGATLAALPYTNAGGSMFEKYMTALPGVRNLLAQGARQIGAVGAPGAAGLAAQGTNALVQAGGGP